MNVSRKLAVYAAAARVAELVITQARQITQETCPGRAPAGARAHLLELQDQLGELLRHAGHVPPQTIALRTMDGRLLVVRLDYHPVSSTCLMPRGIVAEVAADIDLQQEALRLVARPRLGTVTRQEVAHG